MSVQIAISHGQRTPEAWAELALRKIINVADTAPQPIRDQAHAYKESIRGVLVNYISMAVQEQRTTDALKAERAGALELATALRS